MPKTEEFRYDVFISYSPHDFQWVERELLPRLVDDGLQVYIDCLNFEIGLPRIKNIENGVLNSRKTLLVLSQDYITSEWSEFENILVQALDPANRQLRLIPIYREQFELPLRLRSLTAVSFADSYDDPEFPWRRLLHALNQSHINNHTVVPETHLDTAKDHFSQSVRDRMKQLNRDVERLTQEQFRVIQMLSGEHQVRISGCPGSGKTLVAAEKAIRLAKAGLKTLFVCHNPLLAEHVEQLTSGSGVRVVPFGTWVARLAGTHVGYDLAHWTNYEEPDGQMLEAAFDALVERGPRYDAIIIDEGQDFRDEWWAIVEAALAHLDTGILYIFHDDNQALLPHRSTYPINRPKIDLSRNCRNAGKIYKLMTFFHAAAPTAELDLKDQGQVMIEAYTPGHEKEVVEEAVRSIFASGYDQDVVLLLGGTQSLDTSPLRNAKLTISTPYNWQETLRQTLERWIYVQDPSGVSFPAEGAAWVKQELKQLSTDPFPNAGDIKLICHVAGQFKVDQAIRHRIKNHPQYKVGWLLKNGTIQLRRRGISTIPLLAAETILHLVNENWVEGLPEPRIVTLRPYHEQNEADSIPMYNVADYKGLESDVILFVTGGRVPLIEQELYVGISRARYLLALLVDKSTSSVLPAGWMRSSRSLET